MSTRYRLSEEERSIDVITNMLLQMLMELMTYLLLQTYIAMVVIVIDWESRSKPTDSRGRSLR